MKNSPWVPHPMKKTFISWSLQKHIPRCPNLTNEATYLNQVWHFLTCSDVPWPVIKNRNQHFFKRRHLVSSWALQMKVLLVEKSEASTFRVLPPKHRAWQSVTEEHGLDRVAKLTPRKKKLYYRIQTRESVVCKLRKKYMTIWRRLSVGQQSSDTVSFVCFACKEISRFLATVVRFSRHKPQGRRGSFKEKAWLCPPWNVSQIPIPFSGHYFPWLPD